MIIWVVAGLLALATGLRIGWALVNRQSLVSAAMIVALGSLTVLAALNWPPLTALVDSALGWPNIATALSLIALVSSATGSCVMITSVASTRGPAATRRLAVAQYISGAVVAAVVAGTFLTADRQPEMTPRAYLDANLGAGRALAWLVPLLYVFLALTLVCWVGLRLSSSSRRGRALFVFTVGSALIVAASAFFALRALARTEWLGVGTAATLLACAMVIVAGGVLLPTVEDWIGARREMTIIAPLLGELEHRHPDLGIGVRPHGPLVFQVAEQLSLISDALYLEAARAQQAGAPQPPEATAPSGAAPLKRAASVARWIHQGPERVASGFPGIDWLHQPDSYTDRDWILAIARQYRALSASSSRTPNTAAGC